MENVQSPKKENWYIVSLIILLIVVGVYAFTRMYKAPKPEATVLPTAYQNPSPIPTSTEAATPISDSGCTADQLKADASFDAGAGNIYGTLTITNISDVSCDITLGNSIKAVYSVTNMTVAYKSSADSQTYSLAPNAKVYSQVHYPNGPQCQSPTTQEPISLTYESGNTKINFKDENGIDSFMVSACSGSENTQIDIWPVSTTSVN